MSTSLFTAFLMLCAAGPASAEIWKCVGNGGADRYQNFPCQFDSLDAILPGSSAAAPSLPAVAAVRATQPVTAGVAASAKTPGGSEPKPGMTPEDVKSVWGEPAATFQDEQIGGRIDVWRYSDNRTVQFNHKRRVLNVHR